MIKLEASLSNQPAAFNRSQYISEVGYINGLGCPIAIIDRRGISAVIPPTRANGFSGKLIVSYNNTMISNGGINSLSSIHQEPELAKRWGETSRFNGKFAYEYIITYDQLREQDWYYDDRLDLLISMHYNSLVMPDLPRSQVRELLESIASYGTGGVMLSAKIVGNWHCDVGYIAAGALSLTVPVDRTPNPPALVMTVVTNQTDIKTHTTTNVEEIKKIVSDVPPVILSEEHLRAQMALDEKCAKETVALLKNNIEEVLTGYKAVFEDIGRLLDLHERLEGVESDVVSNRRKSYAELLKVYSGLTGIIKTVL